MTWTSPKTWVVSDVLTASDMNTYVRDNTADLDTRVDAIAPGLVLLGADNSEYSTTSTGGADMKSFTGLSIPTTSEIVVTCTARKGSGAAASFAVALNVSAGGTVSSFTANTAANNEADFAYVQFRLPPYIASYTYLAYGYSQARSAGGSFTNANAQPTGARTNATITSVTIRGTVSSASITGYVGAIRLYEIPGV